MGLFKRLFGGAKPNGASAGNGATPHPSPPASTPEMPFQYETVAGAQAHERWKELARQGELDGFFPVIIGDKEDAGTLLEFLHESEGVDAILKAADAINIADWMRDVQQREPEMFDVLEEGDWPAKMSPQSQLTTPFKILSGRPKKQVFILKVPAAQPWHIPAHLNFGGWNDCPEPAVQVAFARYWHEQYGAVIVANTGDVLEYAVQRPPTTKEHAEALAYEQFVFCTDTVYQGCETLRNLAATLIDAPYWYFWWD